MKIGIYTNYSPLLPINSEGLGRYLSTLIKGFLENGDEVVIASPKWSLALLKETFEDFGINWSDLSILSNDKNPIIWDIYHLLYSKKKKRRKRLKLELFSTFYLRKIASIKSIVPLFFVGLIGVFGSIVFTCINYIIKFNKIIKNKLKTVIKKKRLSRMLKQSIELLFDYMKDSVGREVIDVINRKDEVEIWYVPALYWPEVNDIEHGKVIINVPDIVTETFAVGFSDVMKSKQTEKCRKTLRSGSEFITYCDYVGRELVDYEYGFMGKKWKAITHANHNLRSLIEIPIDVSKQMNVEKDLTFDFAKGLISEIQTDSNIIGGKQLKNIRYIFYASQFRPNKNILNLVKAYEYLIRVKFRHERLVLTGTLKTLPFVEDYIMEHDLKNDIICCNGVSNQHLAALYCCSQLVVNPTLYEGGFPFTFGEGMSVGTPSIMSDIPQVREVLEKAGLEEIMFDPEDYIKMADKIEWALDNRDDLYRLELPLYMELEKRTDSMVANEYREHFLQMS